jgi:hypothetical protein
MLKRATALCYGESPVGSSVSESLAQMAKLAKTVQEAPVIEWDEDVLDIVEPGCKEISASDRRSLRPTFCVTSHARCIPNLYHQRVNHLQEVGDFSSEPKPISALIERLSYPKTSVRHFDRFDGCFGLDITFDIVPLIFRKDNHLRNRFFGDSFNAERFNSNTGFISGDGKLRIDCHPYPTDRIDLCRRRK